MKNLGNEGIGQLTFYTSRFKVTPRGICVCSIVLFASLLFSCARSISPSASAYYAASARHHQLAQGEIPATDREWLSLIEELQRVINADAKGKWADNAQYAIASCWMWLAQNRSDARLDSANTSTEHAIDAFKNLLNTYPNSSHAAEAHYWLGYCLDSLGDNARATTHYQTVLQRYLNQPISEQAQLQLARAYEREQHFTSAMATYQSLVKRSQNSHLVAQAKRRIAKLQSKQELPSKRTDLPPQRIAPSAPQDSAQSQPHPMPTKPSLVQQLGLGVRTVVIDPGHGGKDPGALSQTWGQEKVVALDVSKTLRDILVEKGYHVQLTRNGDTYLPLRDRTRFATTHNADLFVSIHANASTNTSVSGVETYYLALASDESAQRTAAQENIGAQYNIEELDALVTKILKESKSRESRHLAESVQEQLVRATGAKNRGVKHAPFVVLIGTKVPAILVEVGFITHAPEAQKVVTEAYQRQIAGAIARGIEKYATGASVKTATINRRIGE